MFRQICGLVTLLRVKRDEFEDLSHKIIETALPDNIEEFVEILHMLTEAENDHKDTAFTLAMVRETLCARFNKTVFTKTSTHTGENKQ